MAEERENKPKTAEEMMGPLGDSFRKAREAAQKSSSTRPNQKPPKTPPPNQETFDIDH